MSSSSYPLHYSSVYNLCYNEGIYLRTIYFRVPEALAVHELSARVYESQLMCISQGVVLPSEVEPREEFKGFDKSKLSESSRLDLS